MYFFEAGKDIGRVYDQTLCELLETTTSKKRIFELFQDELIF